MGQSVTTDSQNLNGSPDNDNANELLRHEKEAFNEEQQNIFKNVWVPVCHESEVQNPYDFRTSSIGNDNIIVCRAPDGKVNALLNVCPHRGMLIERRPQGSFLEGQASGNPKRITCMFHAWQFDMRGNCVYVAREKEGYQDRFCKDDAGLRRLRCSVGFGGFVWVNMNDQPIALLEEWIGEALSPIEKQISSSPLEVVHYHKEMIQTGYKDEILNGLERDAGLFNCSFFPFGHCASHSADEKPVPNGEFGFPAPNATQAIKVDLFPGYVFHLNGPSLHVSTITPVSRNQVMVEHRGLAPKDDNKQDRLSRCKHYNSIFGPFRPLQTAVLIGNGESENKNPVPSKHYNEEWSRWMEGHYNREDSLSNRSLVQGHKAKSNVETELSGQKVVVVGASHAGIAFADKLRKNNFTGPIAIFDRQVGGPMERPPLSKGFLLGGGETVEAKSLLRQKKWYKTNKVRLKTQSIVHSVDTKQKTITVNNGIVVNYDKLVIASGATPRELPDAIGVANAFTLRQPSDANAIRQAANNADSVVIIGGGYIGLEVAASLRKKGMAVTVIEAAERILARVASKPLAEHFQKLHEKHGVKIFTNIGVDKINHEDGIFAGVVLSDGIEVKADMLITGIGVFPDSKLAADAGIETQREDGGAILVDETMQTSDVDVYAIGDVAIRRDQSLAVESVHNAQETASIAAAAITNSSLPVIQTPWFWSDQYDTKLQSVGIVPVADSRIYQVARPGKKESGISFWSYIDEKLIAVEVVNDPATYMEARQCLDTKQSPDPKQISNRSYSPIDSGGARS